MQMQVVSYAQQIVPQVQIIMPYRLTTPVWVNVQLDCMLIIAPDSV